VRKGRHVLAARLSIRAEAITELGIVSSESSGVRSRVERKPTLSTTPSVPWTAICSPIRKGCSPISRSVPKKFLSVSWAASALLSGASAMGAHVV